MAMAASRAAAYNENGNGNGRNGGGSHGLRDYHAFNDAELVRQVTEGDERSFAELVDRYNDRLSYFLNMGFHTGEDTEDILQETWIRVFRHADRFNQNKKFSTWVYIIASNLGKNYLRDKSRRGGHIPLDNADPDNKALISMLSSSTPTPYDILVREEEKEELYRAIDRLKPRYQRLLRMRLEERTYDEIAAEEELVLGTVKSRLSRGKEYLARILTESASA